MISNEQRLIDVLHNVKRLAAEYYRLTNRPLGVTGEVAEYEAIRLLKLHPALVRQSGFDATRETGTKVQIKGRCVAGPPKKSSQRLGEIDLRKEWDSLVFVILDHDFQATEIYEAEREKVAALIDPDPSEPESFKAKLPIRKFVMHSCRVWPSSSKE